MNGRRGKDAMRKLAIIGASWLQAPLILRAKEMGLETHVFAWAANDIGERLADRFYPISITEKEEILSVCRDAGIAGVASIASDLAAVTVAYVAENLGLTGNGNRSAFLASNKRAMREAFARHGDPSPRSLPVKTAAEVAAAGLAYPIIIKPTDRSGSRGITRLETPEGLPEAIARAAGQGFEGAVLAEEFAPGAEYSVEGLSWRGEHRMLAITKKFTTGAPHFIETGHLQPAPLDAGTAARVRDTVFHALDSLEIRVGASHAELKIAPDGAIRLIEIGARMGGDLIGSDLVPESTGVDYVGEVIRCALGETPLLFRREHGCGGDEDGTAAEWNPLPPARRAAAVRFIFGEDDLRVLSRLKAERPELLVREEVQPVTERAVTDSSSRFGAFVMHAPSAAELMPWMPEEEM